MKYLIFLFITAFFLSSVHAQKIGDTTGALMNLKSSALQMVTYFNDKNFDEFVNYTHPKILTLIGGKDKMIAAVKASFKQMSDEGFVIDTVSVGEPDTNIVVQNELQNVISETLEMKNKDGRLVATSYLVAISDDNGKTWYFIDTGGKNLRQLQTVFPTLSNNLVIPEKTQPKFYKN